MGLEAVHRKARLDDGLHLCPLSGPSQGRDRSVAGSRPSCHGIGISAGAAEDSLPPTATPGHFNLKIVPGWSGRLFGSDGSVPAFISTMFGAPSLSKSSKGP